MKFKPIVNPSPADLILDQILKLLESGELLPGEQLPPENVLQKSFNVTKQQLKSAFKQLELYGVIETRPQSGTYIANIYSKILIGLVRNILDFSEKPDFYELYEARMILEVRAAEKVPETLTKKDLKHLKMIHNELIQEIADGGRGGELDIFFHMEIMRLCRNKTMISMFSLIARNLVEFWRSTDDIEFYISSKRSQDTIAEHQLILDAFEKGDALLSGEMMNSHLEKAMSETKIRDKETE